MSPSKTLTPADFGMVQATAYKEMPDGQCIYIKDGKIVYAGNTIGRPKSRETKPDLVVLSPADYKSLCAFDDKFRKG